MRGRTPLAEAHCPEAAYETPLSCLEDAPVYSRAARGKKVIRWIERGFSERMYWCDSSRMIYSTVLERPRWKFG